MPPPTVSNFYSKFFGTSISNTRAFGRTQLERRKGQGRSATFENKGNESDQRSPHEGMEGWHPCLKGRTACIMWLPLPLLSFLAPLHHLGTDLGPLGFSTKQAMKSPLSHRGRVCCFCGRHFRSCRNSRDEKKLQDQEHFINKLLLMSINW